jgi:hypothetical protein
MTGVCALSGQPASLVVDRRKKARIDNGGVPLLQQDPAFLVSP